VCVKAPSKVCRHPHVAGHTNATPSVPAGIYTARQRHSGPLEIIARQSDKETD
jgi:hypothetical protein